MKILLLTTFILLTLVSFIGFLIYTMGKEDGNPSPIISITLFLSFIYFMIMSIILDITPSEDDVLKHKAYYREITHISEGDTIKTYKIEYINN